MKPLSGPQVQALLAFACSSDSLAEEANGRDVVKAFALPGTDIDGRYTILDVLGSGGMGVVYRATDRLHQRTVALKLQAFASQAERGRFTREAELLGRQSHPRLVGYIGHGELPNRVVYLAMELVDGAPLSVWLSDFKPTVSELVAIGLGVAEGLAALHATGVVHRDLKPANILIADGDVERARLVDLGIARPRDLTSLTATGVMMGTPEYMAPEQVRDPRDVDARSDLFSLGCVLYECAAGDPPFVNPSGGEVMRRILFEDPPHISDRRPGLPVALAELVMSLLSKDRDARPRSAAAVVDILGTLARRRSARFALGMKLAGGAVFDVFEAGPGHDDLVLKRLKIVHFLAEDDRRTVASEARRAAAWSHPHVATPIEVLETPQEIVLVCRRLQGPRLDQVLAWVRSGVLPMDLSVAARVGADIVGAVRDLHAAGLTHGAVQPSNVLFDQNGCAVLLEPMPATSARGPVGRADRDFVPPEVVAMPGIPPLPAADVYATAQLVLHALSCAATDGALPRGLPAALSAAASPDAARRARTLAAVAAELARAPSAPHPEVRGFVDRLLAAHAGRVTGAEVTAR